MIGYRINKTQYSRYASRYKFLVLTFFFCISLLTCMATAGEGHLSKAELDFWNSPGFRKQFAESYLSETEIEPRVTESERDKILKALGLIQSDKMDEAARLLQKETKAASSAVFDFTLANIYFQQEQLEQAAGGYERAVQKFPKFRRAWKNLGLIYIRNGQFEKAIDALTRVLSFGGNDALTFAQLGFAYLSVENNLCAESAYRMAVLLDPATIDWKVGLATSVLKQERYAEAVALFDSLISDNPNRADLWLYQANAYIGLNQPLKAAVNYELVDRLGGSTSGSLNKLGDIYVNQELFETAVNSYIRALEKDPQTSTQHAIKVAKVLVFHSALGETKSLIERIEALNANKLNDATRKELLKLRAQIAVAEGSGDEQVKVLEEIVALDPLDGQALILLGQQYGRSGNFDKAVFYYERAEGLEKFEADAKVRHAQLLVGQGKYAEALPLLRRAQDLKPREDVGKYFEQVERFAKSR